VSPSRLAITGTNNSDASTHFLVNIDLDVMTASLRSNPIKSHLQVKEHVSCAKWASSKAIVCAMGRGNIDLITVQEHGTMQIAGNANGVHTDEIRDLAIMPTNETMFASGGFDKRLCLVDLTRRHVIQKLDTNQTVGSVKWDITNEACVNATVDQGKFYIFDTRSSWAKPSVAIKTGIPELYTNERFSVHDLLLGFGSGRIAHYDLRTTKEMGHIADPYVKAVGNIQYNQQAAAFAVSGLQDTSIWKHDASKHAAHFRCHSLPGDNARTGLYAASAVFVGDDSVLTVDSAGMASVLVMSWNELE